jgi:exosortase H (IPTLxxWG-CTERM-specific)
MLALPPVTTGTDPPMLRFALMFPLLIVVLFAAYLLQPVDDYIITPFTSVLASISTWLIDLFDDDAIAMGKVIQSASTGFAVSIERGCNGLEAVIILFAALFAFPAPFKHRIIGFVIGFFAIQSLNLVRIISLFYIGQWSQVWFDWFHHYLWQALIILDALVVWLIWLRYLPRPAQDGPAAPAAPAAPASA